MIDIGKVFEKKITKKRILPFLQLLALS
ncbi:MAG: hypothetical protein BTN85_1178 [Candidatus Methanohalarchaeum thermophilum]|uniref:Uncharacterized protein n=1 Tax=Methanohalarchaeum thermophilum TaxID=1903181 RepID=A0A1Q6DWD8_METT1|nr:MAG: hypothetical protein BTN85_1178 [Candidatus Methanohalarchaeum thermophilum]